MDDLARAFAMERRFDQRLSTRIAPFAFGTAFFDDHHRDRFVSNFLNVEGALDAVEPHDLAHSADEILGSAGYAHRMVLVRSEEHGARWAPAFEAAGYRADPIVLMCLRRDPDRAHTVDARERTLSKPGP